MVCRATISLCWVMSAIRSRRSATCASSSLARSFDTARGRATGQVAQITLASRRRSVQALAEAEARLLVTSSGAERYTFLHDRIREALLAELTPPALRRLHQCIAEVLEEADSGDPRYVYATARHYALGEYDRTPEKVYGSGFAAGRLALADHAPVEALEFMEVAAAAAQAAGLTPDPGFHLARGRSCARTGRFVEALDHLEHALQGEPHLLRRAEILAEIAQVHTNSWDPGRALDAVLRGLAELGRPMPRNRLALVVTTLGWFLGGLAVGLTKLGFGTAAGECQERFRLQAFFYDIAGTASALRMDLRMRAIMAFRGVVRRQPARPRRRVRPAPGRLRAGRQLRAPAPAGQAHLRPGRRRRGGRR